MFNLPFLVNRSSSINPFVLIIMDGFGIAPPSSGNAITLANKPNYDFFWNNYPHTQLLASGESVGLPANEVGNTEVGHLTIGAGRVILQDLKRINLSIEKGNLFDNAALIAASAHVKAHNSKLHLMGLVSTGNVHSSFGHLKGLLQFCKKEELTKVYLHAFTDGRDAPPNESINIIEDLEKQFEVSREAKIASISGRYYAMDRDRRWSRTEKAYKALVLGQGVVAKSAVDAIKGAYSKGQTDEFIEPTVIVGSDGKPNLIEDNDAVIFFNYRIDRPRQLTMAFVMPNFEKLKSFDFGYDPELSKEVGEVKISETFNRVKVLKNIFFVTMTQYQENLPVSAVAFEPEKVKDTIGWVISEAGLRQLHMAESEKERFVTYYFNGLKEDKYPGEDDLIIPSPKVATYDKKPEMSLPKLVGELKKQIRRNIYKFIVVNFANPDMVAHTGNLKASIKAIEIVDKYLGELVREIIAFNGTAFITADHGNAEELISFPSVSFYITSDQGTVNTEHSNNPIPFLIVNKKYYRKDTNISKGGIADIAPTILSLMSLKPPQGMTGNNLLDDTNYKSDKVDNLQENL